MSLKEVFSPYFAIGAALPAFVLSKKEDREVIRREYSSLTCENEMKPENVLDAARNMADPARYVYAPALDFSKARPILDYAKENHIPMRGHTLVWHNQTPEWFFHDGFDLSRPLCDREEMKKRMEGYIREVVSFVQEEYPGLIYAWDVVNEAVLENGIRESLWTKTLGEDYVLWAFRYAKKYIRDAELFYNDYETFLPWKREKICSLILQPLCREGLVDGMGMQSHMDIYQESFADYEESLTTFSGLVKKIHVTELDVHTSSKEPVMQQRLALYYSRLFLILLEAKKKGRADVSSVTFWGLNDEYTWLSYFKKEKSYPLIFDGNYQPKSAYWALVSLPDLLEKDE